MTTHDLLTTSFVVTVEGQPVTLRKLPTSGELAFLRELGRRCKASWGPGGFAANCKEMWQFFRANGMNLELTESVRKVTELQAGSAPPDWDALMAFRQSPAGVAFELWFRSDRAAHPHLDEQAVAAMITETNAWEIHEQITKGLADDPKSRPGATVQATGGGGLA